MASWRITKINNATHEVEMQSNLGDIIYATVPVEHRDLAKHKVYLQSLIDAREHPKVKALNLVHRYYEVAIILILLAYILKLKLG